MLLTLVFAELGVRAYLWLGADEELFKKYATVEQQLDRYAPRVIPHRYLGYSLNPVYRNGKSRHNSLGFRGGEFAQPKPVEEFRIVCLGGSTTYTLAVKDDRLTYPSVLEKELLARGFQNVTVINAGVPGYSSWESLVNFQFRVLDLSPDLIVIYHGVNDIHARLVWPPASYRGDNSGRRAAPSLSNPTGIGDLSALARVLMIRAGWIVPGNAFANAIDIRPDTYHGDEFMRQKRNREHPSGIFEEMDARKMLAINKPTYYRRNLDNLIAMAERQGVETVLATFAFSPRFRDRPRASSPEYIAAYEEMNQVVRDLATVTSAQLFDFAKVFPTGKRLYTDGRHVTAAGAALKARFFADFLTASGLLPGVHPASEVNRDSPAP